MKIKEISYSKNRKGKFGLPQYSSVGVDIGAIGSLDIDDPDDQDVKKQYVKLKEIVQAEIEEELSKYTSGNIPEKENKSKLDERDPSMDWPAYKPKNG